MNLRLFQTEWMPGKDQLLAWVEASLADRHTARMVMNAVDDSCYVHLESKELTLTGAYGDLPVCAMWVRILDCAGVSVLCCLRSRR